MTSTILFVDDEPDLEALVLQKFRRQIRDGVVQFVFARDGVEALASIEQNPHVDMVISDINMPRMDGLQLLASLKASAEWCHIPVVMITTEGGAIKVGEAGRLGAAGYVRKPFSAEQIKEKLTGILKPDKSI